MGIPGQSVVSGAARAVGNVGGGILAKLRGGESTREPAESDGSTRLRNGMDSPRRYNNSSLVLYDASGVECSYGQNGQIIYGNGTSPQRNASRSAYTSPTKGPPSSGYAAAATTMMLNIHINKNGEVVTETASANPPPDLPWHQRLKQRLAMQTLQALCIIATWEVVRRVIATPYPKSGLSHHNLHALPA